jgi:Zn-dependent protease
VSDEGGPRRPTVPGGLQVGRVLGVPLVIQPIWFLIVVVFTVGFGPEVRQQVPGLGVNASYVVALVFVLLLYGSVLLHEISHVAVAKALGMEVRRIVLQLLGGVSEVVEEQPGQPDREYLVAAAGPLTSVLLGGVGFAAAGQLTQHTVPWLLVYGFGYVNAIVAAFNLLPGLPLDGGRVLRAAVWHVTHNKARATLAAGWVGRGLAVAVAVYALFGQANPNGGFYGARTVTSSSLYLFVLAFFIWMSASLAIAQARVSEALPQINLRALIRRALPVSADVPVAEAVRRAREVSARALVVVDAYGRPSGLVSEAAVSSTPAQRQPWMSISDLARPVEDGLVLRTDLSAEGLLLAVQTTPATEYLVLEPSGDVSGVLARTDLVAALQAAGLR